MDRCALFVDAGYLLADGAMAVHGTRHRDAVTWDYPGLLQLLSNFARERTGLPILRCYWYEATLEGRRTAEHDVLAEIPGLKLRLARMRPGRREGVDAQVHRDLMTLARNSAICDAVVVSGDEDLAQVVCDAQDLGIRVSVVNVANGTADPSWSASRALRQECDDLIELSSTHLRPYVTLNTATEVTVTTGKGRRSIGGGQEGHHALPGGSSDRYALGTGETAARPEAPEPARSDAQHGAASGGGQHTRDGDQGDARPAADAPAPSAASGDSASGDQAPAAGSDAPASGGPTTQAADTGDDRNGASPASGGDGHAASGAAPSLPAAGDSPTGQASSHSSSGNGSAAASVTGGETASTPRVPEINLPSIARLPSIGSLPSVGSMPSMGGLPSRNTAATNTGSDAGHTAGHAAGHAANHTGHHAGSHTADGLPAGGSHALPSGTQTGNAQPLSGDPALPGGQTGGGSDGTAQPDQPVSSPVSSATSSSTPAAQAPSAAPTPSVLSSPPPPGHSSLPPSTPPDGIPAPQPQPQSLPSAGTPVPGAEQTLPVSTSALPPAPPSTSTPMPAPPASPAPAAYPGYPDPGSAAQPAPAATTSAPIPALPAPVPTSTTISSSRVHDPGAGQPAPRSGGSHAAPSTGGYPQTGGYSSTQSVPVHTPIHGPNTSPHGNPPPAPQGNGTTTLADAVQSAHKEGHDFGESVAKDAPALWLEAVLARKPRMPSDLEARLLQGSSLPIDFLLHDEVRHALRRGFWDALERARR